MNVSPLTALVVGVRLIGITAFGANAGDSLSKAAATDHRTIEVTPGPMGRSYLDYGAANLI